MSGPGEPMVFSIQELRSHVVLNETDVLQSGELEFLKKSRRKELSFWELDFQICCKRLIEIDSRVESSGDASNLEGFAQKQPFEPTDRTKQLLAFGE